MYSKELEAIRRQNRFREREVADPEEEIIDLASNDYLGLAHKRAIFDRAVRRVRAYPWHGPKSSQLVGGYHPIHAEFEEKLCAANGFEAGIVVGSGYLANLSLIESLVRRKDVLFIDASFHASGMMALPLVQGRVVMFAHNDVEDLKRNLEATPCEGRRIIAVEGIYSMEGDRLSRAVFEIADRYDALLIVDEAHSAGVLGQNLLGVFDAYGIVPRSNHIKMGTLGKAYGSYGAYILASGHLIEYLQNRAKPIIYATAPSLVDTMIAIESFDYIQKHAEKLRYKIQKRQKCAFKILGTRMDGLILSLPVSCNAEALALKRKIGEAGFAIGAIRQPTVKEPILRIILRTSVSYRQICRLIRMARELFDA